MPAPWSNAQRRGRPGRTRARPAGDGGDCGTIGARNSRARVRASLERVDEGAKAPLLATLRELEHCADSK